ncbi:thioesterase [Paraflavitalea soli]|uniref:Thioesterase n=1 Tax=Paraflavitalea soli TaxID=2315862 RepID=A0A3B7MNE7_9BACT|nr:alpha/beta fold hydrolase [Paraflavitalea soli]AXY74560.1 thioesterase [Paraflavitalea soli]
MMKPQLFLLHFAGGNGYSFEFMRRFWPDFEFIPLELPGRGKRINEALLYDLEAAAADICQLILKRLHTAPFLLFGHSMGSILALRVTALLEGLGKPPLHLVVSGTSGPKEIITRKRHLMPRQEFMEELKIIGGIPDEILGHAELFDFFEPILKADFQVVETYDYSAFRPVQTPILAMMGSQEESAGNIGHWKAFTLSSFAAEILEGGHFFIYPGVERLCQIIRACYKPVRSAL